jgi:hypothetical protein
LRWIIWAVGEVFAPPCGFALSTAHSGIVVSFVLVFDWICQGPSTLLGHRFTVA